MLLQRGHRDVLEAEHRDDVEDEEPGRGEAPAQAEHEEHRQQQLGRRAEVGRDGGVEERHVVFVHEERQRRVPVVELRHAGAEEDRADIPAGQQLRRGLRMVQCGNGALGQQPEPGGERRAR